MPKQLESIYSFEFTVPAEAVDENGHANNVMYVQWMQDAAVRHYEAMGGTKLTQAIGATWVVRSHMIKYLIPAFMNERIRVLTCVATMRRVHSLRRYQFIRIEDGQVLVQGETDWVFVDANTGRPRAVPPNIVSLFTLVPDGLK